MALYNVVTENLTVGTVADDELDALNKAADLLDPEAAGSIVPIDAPDVEEYEPEGPG